MNLDAQFKDAGVGITHYLAGGLYAKETHIPAGVRLVQHAHVYDHLSALMQGTAVVDLNGSRRVHHAPAILTIHAHQVHEVTAVTDVVWACIHATPETDPERIDAGLIE